MEEGDVNESDHDNEDPDYERAPLPPLPSRDEAGLVFRVVWDHDRVPEEQTIGRTVFRHVYHIQHNITQGDGGFSMDEVDDEINEMFRNIVEDSFRQIGQNETMSIQIDPGPDVQLPNYPLGYGYFKRKDYDHRIFMHKLSQVSQSNEDFFIGNVLVVKVSVLKPLRVGKRPGKTNVPPQGIDAFFAHKTRSIHIVEPNNDRSCAFWAIALGIRYHEFSDGTRVTNIEEWTRYKRNVCNLQEQEAKKLCRRVGIDYSKAICDLDHVKMIDEYLKRTNRIQIIMVPRVTAGNPAKIVPAPIYPDPFKIEPDTKIIGLEYIKGEPYGHVNFISNFTAYFSKEHFCPRCWKADRSRKNHHCKECCSGCGNIFPCIEDPVSGKVICKDCGTYTFNDICADRHSTQGHCQKMQSIKCNKCLVTFRDDRDKKRHKCFFKQCKLCKSSYQITPHNCHVQSLNLEKLQEEDSRTKVFVFFDIETRQDVPVGLAGKKLMRHVPTLVVAHVMCDECIDRTTTDKKCEDCPLCGVYEYSFTGDSSVNQFGEWLFDDFADKIATIGSQRKIKIMIHVFAHNFMRFDGHFILEYIWQRRFRDVEMVMNGRKIMMVKVGNIKMVDSLCLFQQPLAALPTSFGFQDKVKKGFFPFLFDREENVNKGTITMPDRNFFSSKYMKPHTVLEFNEWYEQHKQDPFNLETDRLGYCRSDVEILRRAVLTYRKSFADVAGFDPLTRRFTLPSVGLEYFRTRMNETTRIGITPNIGYIPEMKSSLVCSAWLDWTEKQTGRKLHREQHLGPFYADAVDYEEKTVYEFWGCNFHGCECLRKDIELNIGIDYNNNGDNTEQPERMDEDSLAGMDGEVAARTRESRFRAYCEKQREKRDKLRAHVQKKLNYYESNGFKVVQRWEHEAWDSSEMADYIKKRKQEWQDIKYNIGGGLKDALFGGRVNFTRLSHVCGEGEKIRYVDFLSLYPTVLYTSKFPTGHPQILTSDIDENITYDNFHYFGFLCCKILPPTGLNLPVIPSKINGKLYFTLCRTCALSGDQGASQSPSSSTTCSHSDDQRSLSGTWTTVEIHLALKKGYKILKTYVVYQFDTSDDGIFKDYIRTWLKIKQEASGWPASTNGATEEETKERREEYIQKWLNDFDIKLDENSIEKNPAKRSLAKLKLNSLWGL